MADEVKTARGVGKVLNKEELEQLSEEIVDTPILVCHGFSINLMNLDVVGLALVLGMEGGDDLHFYFAHHPDNIPVMVDALGQAYQKYLEVKGEKAN